MGSGHCHREGKYRYSGHCPLSCDATARLSRSASAPASHPSDPSSKNSADRHIKSSYTKSRFECKIFYLYFQYRSLHLLSFDSKSICIYLANPLLFSISIERERPIRIYDFFFDFISIYSRSKNVSLSGKTVTKTLI